ncbi:hypothetical protein A2U01_0044980, partial [Trifolium medium]|nr:hypothetical protein [Trifolium medium]
MGLCHVSPRVPHMIIPNGPLPTLSHDHHSSPCQLDTVPTRMQLSKIVFPPCDPNSLSSSPFIATNNFQDPLASPHTKSGPSPSIKPSSIMPNLEDK